MSDVLLVLIIVSLVIGVAVYLVQVSRLLRRLEKHHPAVHGELGSPSPFLRNNARNNVAVFRWLWNREFDSLDRTETAELAAQVRTLLLSNLAGFGLLVLVLFALLLRPG
jgi:hypothetical protein